MAHKDALVAAMIGSEKRTTVDPNQQFDVNPTNDKIVVRKAGPKQTASGLTLPENSRGVTDGEVVATGPGAYGMNDKRRPMSVKVGDKVLLHKTAGTEIEINGEKLYVMNENELLAVITPKS